MRAAWCICNKLVPADRIQGRFGAVVWPCDGLMA
jgi:hypothetical protein